MKRSAIFLICAIAMLLNSAFAAENYVEDHIIIGFLKEATNDQRSEIAGKYDLVQLQTFTLVKNAVLYQTRGSVDIFELASKIEKAEQLVEYACPNFIRKQAALPNDPLLGEQWYLSSSGGSFRGFQQPPGFGIRFNEAMEIYQPLNPDRNVLIAVLDGGISALHPDIFPNLSRNPQERFGVTGVDDDGNGYIDDFFGWDFVDDDANPSDELGHGTHVAGIIGAAVNNAEGVAGVAQHVALLPVRVSDREGYVVSDSILEAAAGYAIARGARIINGSFGGYAYSAFQQSLFNQIESEDVLFVLAAGNGGSDGIGDDIDSEGFYPAGYDGNTIVSVANIAPDSSLHPSSNYGLTRVDLGAPGTEILSTTINRSVFYSENFEGDLSGWQYSTGYGSPFEWGIFTDILGNKWLCDSAYKLNGDRLFYEPNTNSYLQSPVIDLSGRENPKIKVKIFHELAFDVLLTSVDTLDIQVSRNSGPFETVKRIWGYSAFLPVGTIYEVDLQDYKNEQIQLRFLLKSDGVYQDDGVYIDDLSISAVSTLEYDGDEYEFKTGTSMAAPVVSGVAGLVMAQRPDLHAREVRNILMASAQPLESLTGKTVSGGMVDAQGALEMAIAANYAPVAMDDTFSTTVGSAIELDLLANDYDEDGDSIAIHDAPASDLGALTLDASGLVFEAEQVGTEQISYKITDGEKFGLGYITLVVSEQLSFVLDLVASTGGTLTAEPENGPYLEGTQVTVTATPEEGFEFSGWGNTHEGEVNSLVLTMDQNKQIEAVFTPLLYELTVEDSPFGMTSTSSELTGIAHGSQVSLLFTPQRGYTLSGWTGGVESTENPLVLFVTDDLILTPEVEPMPRHTLSLADGEGYTLSAEPDMDFYLAGETVTITVKVEDGYEFTGWPDPLSGDKESILYEFPGISENEEMVVHPTVAPRSNGESIWSDFEAFGDWQSGWLGWITSVDAEYLFHLNLGTLYYAGTDPDSVWLYVFAGDHGWLWAGKGLYPLMFSPGRGWIMHLEETDWFVDWDTEEWFQISP